MYIKNLHGIHIKCLPCTDTKGARVKMTSARFRDSITLPYDYTFNSIREMAGKWLQDRGQVIVGAVDLKNEDIILLEAIDSMFIPLKKMSK